MVTAATGSEYTGKNRVLPVHTALLLHYEMWVRTRLPQSISVRTEITPAAHTLGTVPGTQYHPTGAVGITATVVTKLKRQMMLLLTAGHSVAAPGLMGPQLGQNLGNPMHLGERCPRSALPPTWGREPSKPGRHLKGTILSAMAQELTCIY